MAHKSTAAKIAELRRRLGTDRYVDALLVVEHPDGRELWRAGGLWDRVATAPDGKRGWWSSARPAVPHRVRLKQSQVEPDPVTGRSIADAIADWLDKMRRGIDDGRPIVLVAAGNRGSGKTFILGSLLAMTVALEWPRGAQFSVNLSDKQKREVIAGWDKVARPEWTIREVRDPRDPFREFITGAQLYWRSGKAPEALREGGITFQYGFVNEGQDQPTEVGVNAVGAIRNVGALVGIATNPDPDGGWIGDLKERIDAAPTPERPFFGEWYEMRAALNDAISQAAQPKIAAALYAIDKDAADADARGMWKRRGQAYPFFSTKARRVDLDGRFVEGHMGTPPDIGWRDVTREETAARFGGVGWDWVGGSDFQHDPGCCAAVGKLYRDPLGELILCIHEFIGAPGDERAFAQALEDRGYFPGDTDFEGRAIPPGRSLVLIGDGTGDIQDATHRRGMPYSFTQLKRYGWKVYPPMKHRSGAPCNPLIPDSLKQVDTILRAGWLLMAPACGEPAAEFCSLVDSAKKSVLNASGKFVKRGHYTHGMDGVRYLCWRFLPRNKLPAPARTRNADIAAMFRGIRLTER